MKRIIHVQLARTIRNSVLLLAVGLVICTYDSTIAIQTVLADNRPGLTIESEQWAIREVNINAYLLRNMDSAMKINRQVVLAAVRKNGLVIEFADISLRSDREVVLEAVKNNGLALKFADTELKSDAEIVIAAVTENRNAIEHAKLDKGKRKLVLNSADIQLKPTYLDKSMWGKPNSSTNCITSFTDNTKLIRGSHIKLELLNESDFSLENSITSSNLKYISRCLVSNDNKILYVSAEHTVQLYDLENLELINSIGFDQQWVKDISFSDTADILNVLTLDKGMGGSDHILYRLDINTNKYERIYSTSVNKVLIRLDGDNLFVTELHDSNVDNMFDSIEERTKTKYVYNIKSGIKHNDDSTYPLCTSKDGNLYFLKEKEKGQSKSSYNLYRKDSDTAILRLSSIHTRHCLIYDNTLLLTDLGSGSSIKKVRIDTDKIDNKRFYPLETLLIIDEVDNGEIIVSHFVSSFYGWDKKNGRLIWVNVWDPLERNHWGQANYDLNIYKDYALMKPYGWSGERINGEYRNDILLRFNIKDGTYIYSPIKKDLSSPIDHETRGLHDGAKYYFTVNGVQFIVFEGFEWLTISEEGYFNASSHKVLENIFISDDQTSTIRRKLNQNEIKKWYRPDIVSNIIQGIPIQNIIQTDNPYVLPEKAVVKNMYAQSMLKEYLENKNLSGIANLGKEHAESLRSLNLLENAKTQQEYFSAYRALGKARALSDDEIEQRVDNILKNNIEQPALIWYLRYKDPEFRNRLIRELYDKNKLTDESKRVIAKRGAYYKKHKLSDLEINIIWEVWEKQHYVRSESQIQYLAKMDKERALKYAVGHIIFLHSDPLILQVFPFCLSEEKNSEIKDKYEGMRNIGTLYDFLISNDFDINIKRLNDALNKRIDEFLDFNNQCFLYSDKLLALKLKISSEEENALLIEKLKNYAEKDTFNNAWDTKDPWHKRSKKIIAIIKLLNKHDNDYIKGFLERYSAIKAKNSYISSWSYLLNRAVNK